LNASITDNPENDIYQKTPARVFFVKPVIIAQKRSSNTGDKFDGFTGLF
jgi:hypothetical protein